MWCVMLLPLSAAERGLAATLYRTIWSSAACGKERGAGARWREVICGARLDRSCAPITPSMLLFTTNSISISCAIVAPMAASIAFGKSWRYIPPFRSGRCRVYRPRKGKSWKDQFRAGWRRMGRPRECRALQEDGRRKCGACRLIEGRRRADRTVRGPCACPVPQPTVFHRHHQNGPSGGSGIGSPAQIDVLPGVPALRKPPPGFERQPSLASALQGIRHPLIDMPKAEKRRPGRPRVEGGLARLVVRPCNFRRPNSQNGSGKKRTHAAR